MKKGFCLIIIACLVLLVGCRSAGTENQEPKGFDYERFNVTQEEIDEQHQKYGKKICSTSVTEDFALDAITVIVYPFAYGVEYTADDFEEIGCTGVYHLGGPYENADRPTKSFSIRINAKSKQEVLDLIKILEERPDIYYAGVDGIVTVQ